MARSRTDGPSTQAAGAASRRRRHARPRPTQANRGDDVVSADSGAGHTPPLLEVLAEAEARVIEELGTPAPPAGHLSADEAERRLEVLFWAERRSEELREQRERARLRERREEIADRQAATTEWLCVGQRASRVLLVIVLGVIVSLGVGALWLSGQLDPAQLVRLLPTG